MLSAAIVAALSPAINGGACAPRRAPEGVSRDEAARLPGVQSPRIGPGMHRRAARNAQEDHFSLGAPAPSRPALAWGLWLCFAASQEQ